MQIIITPSQLRDWRYRHGLSSDHAAETFGLAGRTWRRWENGERKIPPLLPWALTAYSFGIYPPGWRRR